MNIHLKGNLLLALANTLSELSLVSMTPLVALLGAKAMKIPFIPRYRKIMSKVQRFRQLCFKIISDRKNEPHKTQESNDLLSSLLATQTSKDLEARFLMKILWISLLHFLLVVWTQLATSLEWPYNLTQYPQYLQELKEERDRTYNKETIVTADTLQKMDILHSFLKETLRFYTIGQHLAIMEAKVIVSEFLERFEVKLKDGYNLRMTVRFLYEPEEELLFDLNQIKA